MHGLCRKKINGVDMEINLKQVQLLYNDGTYDLQMRAMWDEIFADEKKFADYYFSEVVKRNKTLVALYDGKLIGMIHLNPYMVNCCGMPKKVYYIVGVAVDRRYRGMGIMKHIMNKAIEDMKKEGCPFTFLMPENENYYSGIGFRKMIDTVSVSYFADELKDYISGEIITLEPLSEASDLGQVSARIELLQNSEYDIYTMCTREYLSDLIKQHKSLNGQVFTVRLNGNISGYFACDFYDNRANIENIRFFGGLKRHFFDCMYTFLEQSEYKELKITINKKYLDEYSASTRKNINKMYSKSHGYMIMFLDNNAVDIQKKIFSMDEIV